MTGLLQASNSSKSQDPDPFRNPREMMEDFFEHASRRGIHVNSVNFIYTTCLLYA